MDNSKENGMKNIEKRQEDAIKKLINERNKLTRKVIELQRENAKIKNKKEVK